MNLGRQIQLKVTALLFALSLLFPIAIQFVHSLEHHHHTSCKEITTHLHEKKIDCSVCDFHFSTFHFETINFTEVLLSKVNTLPQSLYTSSEKECTSHHFYLRGPPEYS